MNYSVSRVWTGLALGALVSGLLSATSGTASAARLADCVSSDNGDPVMTEVTFSPSAVDVTDGPETVTVTATARDTGGPGPASGLRFAHVYLGHGNGNTEGVRLSEDASGNWVGTVIIPRWTKPGEWNVEQALLRDRVGQETLYGGEEDDVPLRDTFTVVSTRDATRPALTAFTFTPDTVNTTRREQNMRFTARATDTMSGVAQLFVGVRSRTSYRHAFARLHKEHGTANRYTGRAVIPRWIASSDWRVWYVAVVDRADNYAFYSTRRLKELGFNHYFRVVSRRDTTEPKVVSFSRRPNVVDVRTADQSVLVTARVTDTHSGVEEVGASFRGPHDINVDVNLERVSGTRRDGIWQGTATVHQCPAQSGPLSASIYVGDHRDNDVYYPTRELIRREWPSRLRVLARPDAITPAAHVGRRVPITGPVTLTFNEAVNGINQTSVSVRRISILNSYEGPDLVGRWRCKTGSGTVTGCAHGRVREAIFRPVTDLHHRRYYTVELNPQHSLAVTDLAGNPFDRDQLLFQTVR
jgi:Bacterial Ig-like domain